MPDRMLMSVYPKTISYFLILVPPISCLLVLYGLFSVKSPMEVLRLSYFATYEFYHTVPIWIQILNLISVMKADSRPIAKSMVDLHLQLPLIFAGFRFYLTFHQLSRSHGARLGRRFIFLIDAALMVLIEAALMRYMTKSFIRIIRKIFLVALLYRLNELYSDNTFWNDCQERLERHGLRNPVPRAHFQLSAHQQIMQSPSVMKLLVRLRWIFASATVIFLGVPMLFTSTNESLPNKIVVPLCGAIGGSFFLLRFYLNRVSWPSDIQPVHVTDYERTCQVCYDDKPGEEFQWKVVTDCQHDQRTVCNSCVFQHVQKAFEITFTDDLFCPEPSCGVKFSYSTVKMIFLLDNNEVLMERYDKYVTQREIEKMEEFIWCSNPSCHAGQLNEGGAMNTIVTCYHCRQKTCFIHKVKWHEGMTCDEYTQSLDQDQNTSRQWIVENCKKCPNCPYEIQKTDGCDHMTCIKCRHEFCWSCLADFQPIRQEGNHRHRSTCKYHFAYDE